MSKSRLLKPDNKLSRVSGKKQYGYLKADVKDIVDNIIIELSKDDRIRCFLIQYFLNVQLKNDESLSL